MFPSAPRRPRRSWTRSGTKSVRNQRSKVIEAQLTLANHRHCVLQLDGHTCVPLKYVYLCRITDQVLFLHPSAMYGTSLFVSKQPFDYTTYGSNAGFGAVQPKGLFSGHDDSGTCVSDTYCTAAAASASPPTCASYPMDAPTPVAAAIAAGMPATVAGGKGCPAYPSKMMTECA